jgi:hypothetical protein
MKIWIARDKNGNLWFHEGKPHINKYAEKDNAFWSSDGEYYEVDQDLFPEVTFENSPMEVELVIKK